MRYYCRQKCYKMVDLQLITLADVRRVHNVSQQIADFHVYAGEAQSLYVQKLLGDPLYLALLGAVGDARFQTLMDGCTYGDGPSIFRGLRAYICYIWLFLYSTHSTAKLTPTGIRRYTDPESEDVDGARAGKAITSHFKDTATALGKGVVAYLGTALDTYPEYAKKVADSGAKQRGLPSDVVLSATPLLYKRIK